MTLSDKMKTVNLKDLNPAKYNPNEMSPKERDLLRKSLDHYDYIENIVVNKDMTIIDGHHRVEEMINNGIEKEDVVVLDLSKDEEKALNLALRRIKGKANPRLELELIKGLELKGFDVELAGFDNGQLHTLEAITPLDDEGGEVKDEWEGMPEFNQPDISGVRDIIVHFADERDVKEFATLVGQNITEKTKFIWYPKKENDSMSDHIYVGDDDEATGD